MKMKQKFQLLKICVFLSSFLFLGCSSRYPITYNTNPTGAIIVCGGVNEGYSPVTLYYDPGEEEKNSGTMTTVQCSAHWVSGATAYFSKIWDLKKFPNGVMQTLQRPNVPGYEKDVEFALKVQQMRYQKQQAEAASEAAYQLQQQKNLLQQQNYILQQQYNYLRYGY
jgi:hypothetical protein